MTHKEENIVNIAMRAAELLKDGKIERDDISGHLGLTEAIIGLAEEFETKILREGIDYNAPLEELEEAGLPAHDYWEDIDLFAQQRLMELYPAKEYALEQENKSMDKEQDASANPVKIWARVGMTLEVPQKAYDLLKQGNEDVMYSVLTGNVGKTYVDGETYFPDIEENGTLAEMEFDLYDGPYTDPSYRKETLSRAQAALSANQTRSTLTDILRDAEQRQAQQSLVNGLGKQAPDKEL